MQEYGLLKRNFESLHRYDDEDWCFYRFKVNQRRAKKRSWWRPWTRLAQGCDWLFLDLGCGYGANPWRAVGSAVVIMFLFALVYAAGFQSFEKPASPTGPPTAPSTASCSASSPASRSSPQASPATTSKTPAAGSCSRWQWRL